MIAGLGIRVFTDEMIAPRLASELRRQGYDVLSCRAARRANQSIPDHEQLLFATSQRRAIYTFNVDDFEELHRQWVTAGRSHAGIIVSSDLNANLHEMARRLQLHMDRVDPATQQNRLIVLRP